MLTSILAAQTIRKKKKRVRSKTRKESNPSI